MKAGLGTPMGKATPFAGFSAAQQKRSVSGGGSGAGAVRAAGGGGTTSAGIEDLKNMFISQYEEARAAKQKRYEGGLGILEEVAGMFGPGYLKGEEQKMLASMEQGMVGRGLGGTTVPAAAGMGIKADIRDRATKGRVGAMTNIAQYMAGHQDIYPQPGTLASLATSMESISAGMPPPAMISGGGPAGGPTYMARTANLMNPVQQTGRTTGPGPGVASATTSFGSSMSPPATGAGAATYGVSGGLTPWQQQQASASWWRGVQ